MLLLLLIVVFVLLIHGLWTSDYDPHDPNNKDSGWPF